MNDLEKLSDEWLELRTQKKNTLAKSLYEDEIFPLIVKKFEDTFSNPRKKELLISLLGFSPEPIILTRSTIKPEKHYIITTSNKSSVLEKVDRYFDSEYKLKIMNQISFSHLFGLLREILSEYPTHNITIDITGGKKSMVAIASIFGKEYGCRIVYVDFTEYLPEFRSPKPGTEILFEVYNPAIHHKTPFE